MKIRNVLFLVLLSFTVISCRVAASPTEINSPSGNPPKQILSLGEFIYTQGDDVYRFEDEEAGVVCWIFYPQMYAGGISCLPKEQTKLR